MINRIYKIINNKFSRFFKFVFFLRYLIAIFFVATVFFLLIPQFFDYKKNEEVIKIFLKNNYGIELNDIKKIEYKPLPKPHLQIKELNGNLNSSEKNFKAQSLSIYPELLTIYDFSKFNAKKIKLENSYLETDFEKSRYIIKEILKSKKKIYLKNFNVKLKNKNLSVIDLKKINFLNYGFRKNIVKGEIFRKKFKIDVGDDFKNIDFKLLDTGIQAKLTFSKIKKKFHLN